MDGEALMPTSGGSFSSSKMIYVLGTVSLLFVTATFLMTLIEGARAYDHGFIMMGITLVLLFISIGILMKWAIYDPTIEEKIKHLAFGQMALCVLLCVSTWIVMFEPKEPCPNQLTQCNLLSYFSSITYPQCQTLSFFQSCLVQNPPPLNPMGFNYICFSNNTNV